MNAHEFWRGVVRPLAKEVFASGLEGSTRMSCTDGPFQCFEGAMFYVAILFVHSVEYGVLW